MKRLSELLADSTYKIQGNLKLPIKGIAYHSTNVKPGFLFVAFDGFKTSGKEYIEHAIRNGAVAIASNSLTILKQIYNRYANKITVIQVNEPRKFLAMVANRFYEFPSRKLCLIGITGTNGKTTTSYMLKSILEASGQKCGLIGTIKYYDGRKYLPAPNTTPESLDFVRFLYNLNAHKIYYCISEISSHALALNRVFEQKVCVAIFTNLGQDHLDFHKTIKNYQNAKLQLFTNLTPQASAIVNEDDTFSKKIIKNTQAKVIPYSIKISSGLHASIIQQSKEATTVLLNYPSKIKKQRIRLPMPGIHNIYNMLAAIGAALVLKIPFRFIKNGIENMSKVTGRLQRVKSPKGYDVYIDYAHTEKALATAIKTLRQITDGKLIVVFGCGGNRDRTKRPKMGYCATTHSDYTIITTDNPRNEKPDKIINDITKGIVKKNYEVISNRKTAIKKALLIARPGDTVLIAGKGHENYQIIGNKTINFSDFDIVRNIIATKR